MTTPKIDVNLPPEGWTEPDKDGYVRFTKYGFVNEPAPEKDGYEAFFIAVHGANYTRWTYRPLEKD